MRKIIILSIIFLVACKKPYNPPATSSSQSYLVVEGVINSGTDSTSFKLSRTVNLTDNGVKPETGAILTVESDQNGSYPLIETVAGNYVAAALNLDNSRMYRLRIKTTNNKEYLSDLVPVSNTPPIDSIGFKVQNQGLQVYANTHNPVNNSRYYRWDYSETWKFHSKYQSVYEVSNGALVVRPYNEQVYYCFASDRSDNIILGSSADLSQDVIFQQPITFVSATSEKLENKYSIQLKQYALTKDAFNFWTSLKKNTEQLGSIFDAQPSQISGNIHCLTNPTEPVIGYISVTNVQSKRVFLTNNQLPFSYIAAYPYDCEQDSTLLFNPKTKENEVQDFIIAAPPGSVDATTAITSGGFIIGYFRSSPICADCTLRGTTAQPSFWK